MTEASTLLVALFQLLNRTIFVVSHRWLPSLETLRTHAYKHAQDHVTVRCRVFKRITNTHMKELNETSHIYIYIYLYPVYNPSTKSYAQHNLL